jgi:hypothetical protein
MVLSPEASWIPFERGTTIGQFGSENGVILREEQHTDGARIALERVTKNRLFRSPKVTFAITCGIYGWMVHTRFFESEHQAQLQYDAMKVDISTIIEKLPLENDPLVDQKMNDVPPLLHAFVERYP